MAGEYIFTMQGLSKTYGAKSVFKDIHLSFYHGAKIGIVGGNGAGKSTLLGIMAGEVKEFEGQAQPLKGTKIGYLPQEPVLDLAKPCAKTWSRRLPISRECSRSSMI